MKKNARLVIVDLAHCGFNHYEFVVKENNETENVIADMKKDFGKIEKLTITPIVNEIEFDGNWLEI